MPNRTYRLTAILDMQDRLSAGLMRASTGVTTFGGRMDKLSNGLIRAGSTMQMVGMRLTTSLTMPIVLAGSAAIKFFLDFDKAMRRTAAAAGVATSKTNKDYMSMERAARQAARTTVFSATEAANGLYELVSAGWSARQAAQMLVPVLKFAEAANLDVGDATQYASSQMHLWSSEGYNLTKIMDITSIAVQKSEAHFEDFTHNVQMAGVFAKQGGQRFEELAAAFMIAADRGAPLERTGFNIRQSLAQMFKPTDKARDLMKQLGITYYDAAGKMKPLSSIVDILRTKMAGLTSEKRNEYLQTLFNIRAGGVMRTLMEGTNADYMEYIKKVDQAAGTTKKMADVVEKSASAKFEMMTHRIQDTAIVIGAKLLPHLLKVMQIIDKWLVAFNKLPSATQNQILQLVALLAVFGPVLKIFGALVDVFGFVIKVGGYLATTLGWLINIGDHFETLYTGLYLVLDAVAVAFGTTIGVVLAVIAAIAALAIGAYLLITHWSQVKTFFANLWVSIKGYFASALAWIQTTASNTWESVKAAFSSAWTFIKTTVSAGFTWLVNTTVSSLTNMVNFWARLPGRIVAFLRDLYGNKIPYWIGYGLGWALRKTIEWFNNTINWWVKLPGRIRTIVNNLVDTTVTNFVNFYRRVYNIASDIVNAVVTFFRELPAKVASTVISTAVTVLVHMRDMQTKMIRVVTSIVTAIVEWFQKLPGRIVDVLAPLPKQIGDKFEEVHTKASHAFWSILDYVQTLPEKLYSAAYNMGKRIWDGLKDWFGKVAHGFQNAFAGRASPGFVEQFEGHLNRVMRIVNSFPMDRLKKKLNVTLKMSTEAELNYYFGKIKKRIEDLQGKLEGLGSKFTSMLGTVLGKFQTPTEKKMAAEDKARAEASLASQEAEAKAVLANQEATDEEKASAQKQLNDIAFERQRTLDEAKAQQERNLFEYKKEKVQEEIDHILQLAAQGKLTREQAQGQITKQLNSIGITFSEVSNIMSGLDKSFAGNMQSLIKEIGKTAEKIKRMRKAMGAIKAAGGGGTNQGLAVGGWATGAGLYPLAEQGPELVLPAPVSAFFKRAGVPMVGGGAQTINHFHFGADSVRSDQDIYKLAQAIGKILGRQSDLANAGVY